ncbi:MAG: response regulator, partial [Eubacterium sp.]|nr:response regulator [Eubacterium sp.]
MYQLLIVDDEPLVQAGIRSMLNWSEMNVEICGTAMNGQAALKIIEEKSPDIVITDIKMPVMSGLELAKICRERFGKQHPHFIILTSYEDFHMAKEALTYQVSEYLVKLELTPELLRETVENVIKQIQETESPQRTYPSHVHPFRDKFFISLLHSLFESEEQFILQSRDLSLDFTYEGYVCCYGEIVS